MSFRPFELEQFQSLFERTVEYNLADSSVQCANMRDVLGEEAAPLLEAPAARLGVRHGERLGRHHALCRADRRAADD